METAAIETDVCVVGGGPGGLAAALLLLEKGHRVTVLERHPNFEREYRGEVLTPRFIQTVRGLGWLEYIESQKHLKLNALEMHYRDFKIVDVPISKIAPDAPYAIWMPQPVLLAALNEKAKTYPGYVVYFSAAVNELTLENGAVRGVVANLPGGKKLAVRAKITVAADGRTSAVGRLGKFEHEYDEHDFDVLWFSVPRPEGYDRTLRAFFSSQRSYLILPKYPDLLQCGLILRPGEFSKMIRQGIDSARKEILSAHPVLHDFARSLKDFDPFFLLPAVVHLVKRWAKDGCVLIGDAAHTCSPAGAVGVAVAVQTAVEAADVVSNCLKSGDFSAEALDEIQKRREADVRQIHAMQRRFARGITAPKQFLWLLASALFVGSKTPLFLRFARRLIARQ